MALEVLGISPMGAAMVPAENPSKAQVAYEAGRLVMDVLARGQRPSDIITKEGLENAIAAIATSGGSTNGVLHLLAIASEAGVELDIDDFDRISSATPMLCDLKPGGHVAADLHQAGGFVGSDRCGRARRVDSRETTVESRQSSRNSKSTRPASVGARCRSGTWREEWSELRTEVVCGK